MTQPIQQQLLDALKKIDRPGTFCTSGILSAVLPGLKVPVVGAIPLPLGKVDAAALKKLAHQAPYGKGTKTLVDTKVRRVWEIDAEQVTLLNPQWTGVLDEAVRATQSALGLEKQKLTPHLYKLLLYEKGSFFLSHRDGEKLDRMVATLVIALPSEHEGGELIVRHEGREVTVDFAANSEFETQFAAFYADCEHEVKPVTSGFRLALVYNLTLEKSKRKIAAPTSRGPISTAADLLRSWSEQPANSSGDKAPLKLAVLLDHQYTEAGLTRDALKGTDRAKADILFAAAREADCEASLALVTLWQSGSAAPSNDDYRYGRRRRYGWYEDDSDESGEHEMEDVFDESLTAKHFSDAEGKPLAFGEIPLDEKEIVSQGSLSEGEPDQEEFEGYTGNAGMTLERWYHRAAIVLWPAGNRFDLLCEAGIDSAIGGLAQEVKRWKQAKKSDRESLHQTCITFAKRIIANWPEKPFANRYSGTFSDSKAPASLLLTQLKTLGDPSLISSYIGGVLAKDVTTDPGQELGDICQQYGWSTFREELRNLLTATSNDTFERHAQLLADFSLRRDKDADRQTLCTELAEAMMTAVERWSSQASERSLQTARVNLAKLLPPLVQSFVVLDQSALLERLVTIVLDDCSKRFDLTKVQVPALLSLASWLKRNVKHPNAPLRRWLDAVLQTLESRKTAAPKEPTDWRRDSDTGCKCADCRELSRFLDDPNQETLRFPMGKPRRQHLHNIIGRRLLDTTHTTDRRGSPATLVCKKTKASYQKAFQAYKTDLTQLAKVGDLAKSLKA